MREQTACFTGHRTIPPQQLEDLAQRLRAAVEDAIGRGYRYFGAGGALGFDTLAAQTVLELKKDHPPYPPHFGAALSVSGRAVEQGAAADL